MAEVKLSPDQIACCLWDVRELVSQGRQVEEACQELGISDPNYQRWNREFGNRKPAFAENWEAIVEAEKQGDLTALVALLPEFLRHQKAGRKPRGWTFSLTRKLALLGRLSASIDGKAENIKRVSGGEAWERDDRAFTRRYVAAHDDLIQECSNLLRFYMMRAKKNAKPVQGHLVSDLTIVIKGNIGRLVSSGLIDLMAGRSLSPGQLEDLAVGWRTLTRYIDDLTQ